MYFDNLSIVVGIPFLFSFKYPFLKQIHFIIKFRYKATDNQLQIIRYRQSANRQPALNRIDNQLQTEQIINCIVLGMSKKKEPSTQLNAQNLQCQRIQQIENELNDAEQQSIDQNRLNSKKETACLQAYNFGSMKQQKNDSTISLIGISEDEQQLERLLNEQKYKDQQKNNLIHEKMVVGSGFSLDMTDFFKFKKRKNKPTNQDGLFQSMTGGHLAWIILFYTVCNAAIMPAWIMSIKANKILRISWRFCLQSIIMIPFVLYEKRTGNSSVKNKYKLDYIFTLEGLRKVYISSIGTSIWFTIILSCFQWTYVSHSLTLGSLSNFFLSLSRSFNHSTHQLQPGGQIFVIVGIVFVLVDSFTMNIGEMSHSVWKVVNPLYLTREPISRVVADLAALSGAFIISRFSQMASDLKTYYPPFLSMFLVNISVSFHVGLSAYFINGASFDRDTYLGIWGLFTENHFGGFFYMAIILSFGMYISYTLISKLFTDPIIPALAMTLQPFFATFFINLVSVQSMPGSFTIYGYIFLICGLFLILIGQYLLQRIKEKQEKDNQLQKQLKEKLINQQVIYQYDQQDQRKQKNLIRVNTHRHIQLHEHGYSDILHR